MLASTCEADITKRPCCPIREDKHQIVLNDHHKLFLLDQIWGLRIKQQRHAHGQKVAYPKRTANHHDGEVKRQVNEVYYNLMYKVLVKLACIARPLLYDKNIF